VTGWLLMAVAATPGAVVCDDEGDWRFGAVEADGSVSGRAPSEPGHPRDLRATKVKGLEERSMNKTCVKLENPQDLWNDC